VTNKVFLKYARAIEQRTKVVISLLRPLDVRLADIIPDTVLVTFEYKKTRNAKNSQVEKGWGPAPS
jgi:hypothetical protein